MTTEERLEKLEKELARAERRNRWLLAGAAFVIIVGVGLCGNAFRVNEAMAQPVSGAVKEVRAKNFVLVDQSDRVRAELRMTEDQPGLALFDERGKARAVLSMLENRPALALVDDQGNTRVVLNVEENQSGLALYKERRILRAYLYEGKEGAGLTLYDEQGNSRGLATQ